MHRKNTAFKLRPKFSKYGLIYISHDNISLQSHLGIIAAVYKLERVSGGDCQTPNSTKPWHRCFSLHKI